MQLEIITPENKLFEGSVSSVQLPGVEGKFEILNDHAPIISTLTKGNIRVIHTNNKTELFKINSCLLYTSPSPRDS